MYRERGEKEGDNNRLPAALTSTAVSRVGTAHTLRAERSNLLGGSYTPVRRCFTMRVYIQVCVCTVL